MDNELEKIELFKRWCDENLISAVGLRRIDLEQFNELIEKSYVKIQSINDNSNRLSYLYGITVGMKLMLPPKND